MSQTKITPGPFYILPDDSDTNQECQMITSGADKRNIICSEIFNPADARAIAAVPKMIEALQTILLDTGDRESDIETANAALRQAGIEVE